MAERRDRTMTRSASRVAGLTVLLLVPGLAALAQPGREHLTAAELSAGTQLAAPVPESAFAMPQGASPARHRFEGRLELLNQATAGSFAVVTDPYGMAAGARTHLPPVDLELTQVDDRLVPFVRGLQVTGSPVWNLIVEPGRVWTEAGDLGMTRAALPFALVESNQNCVHNGTFTFLFDDQSVTRVWYQVTQETCVYFKVDLWGMVDARWHRGAGGGADAVRAAFEEEQRQRFPTAPLTGLANRFPGAEPGRISERLSPEHLTTHGLVLGGVHYVGECGTRYGPSPFCAERRFPSYSLAKSLLAGVALMRLAQRYGPEVVGEQVVSWLPEAAARGDWTGVTFGHALDMVTGHYGSTDYMADDESEAFFSFIHAQSRSQKLAVALAYPAREPPGRTWAYRTVDTFIVVCAMERYLQARAGADADLLEMVVDEVYRAVGVGPGAWQALRTSDNGWRGTVIGGYGMFLTGDDIAKLGTFLYRDLGAADGRQILHRRLLRATLHMDPSDRGPATGYSFRYNNAFWGAELDATAVPEYGRPFWVAYMLGWGGIEAVLMPNGAVFYHADDADEFSGGPAIREAMRLLPHDVARPSPPRRVTGRATSGR